MKTRMTGVLEELGNWALEQDQPHEFTGRDLVNACLVLQHVAHSIAFNSTLKTVDEASKDAEVFGSTLRDALKAFTGLDMHEVVREL